MGFLLCRSDRAGHWPVIGIGVQPKGVKIAIADPDGARRLHNITPRLKLVAGRRIDRRRGIGQSAHHQEPRRVHA